MPHRCVKCTRVYSNSSPQLLHGCECGSRIFLFLKPDQLTLAELDALGEEFVIDNQKIVELSREKPVSVELDLPLIEQAAKPSSQSAQKAANPAPLIPRAPMAPREQKGAENIRILERGLYELDLDSLMAGDPIVVRSEHGIYYVKIHAFKKSKSR